MTQSFVCWDGPCEGRTVEDVLMSAEVGDSCAIPWDNMGKASYAVYVVLERPDGARGLVYERHTYSAPWKAERRVRQLMDVVRQHRRRSQAAAN